MDCPPQHFSSSWGIARFPQPGLPRGLPTVRHAQCSAKRSKAPTEDHNQMLKPPQLAPFHVKEQWLYYEVPRDVRALLKDEPGHPAEETTISLCGLLPKPHDLR